MVRSVRGLSTFAAIVVAGCGSRSALTTPDVPSANTDAAIAFPVGTYANCAAGVFNGSLNAIGFRTGASLTVSQRGSNLSAQYVDENHRSNTFDFAITTNVSATLSPAGQVASGFSTDCVQGPGRNAFIAANLTAADGALTYDSNAVFVALTGTVEDTDAGPCGVQSLPANFWIACQGADGGAPETSPLDAGAPEFPVGEYACNSQVATFASVGGTNQYVANGGAGMLTLARSGGELITRYVGAPSVSGSLRFIATSTTSARAETDQSIQVSCDVPITMGGTTQTPGPMSVSAGSIMLVGSTVFVTLLGTMTSVCTGAEKSVTLICSPR